MLRVSKEIWLKNLLNRKVDEKELCRLLAHLIHGSSKEVICITVEVCRRNAIKKKLRKYRYSPFHINIK